MRKEKTLKLMNQSFWDLPSPTSLTYMWNMGATLGIVFMIQIVSGIFLSFHYISFTEESFNSIICIMREVWSGWIFRFVHMNGASMFFFFIYLHLFRGLFYFSSTQKKVWSSGVVILLILMAISFMGYVLPWGQMSFWGAAVITNLFSIIPILGEDLVKWIWGGFAVGEATLIRFFSLHFALPFFLLFMVGMHLYFLHDQGSSNSIGVSSNMDKINFHPFFTVKDLYFIIMAFIFFLSLSFFQPFILGDSVNNVPANPMVTPIHIQPEWYFLPYYAILRALPTKTAGVLALFLSVSLFFILPNYSFKFSSKFSLTRSLLFWIFVTSFMFLMKLGSMTAEEPFISMSKILSFIYFSSILLLNC